MAGIHKFKRWTLIPFDKPTGREELYADWVKTGEWYDHGFDEKFLANRMCLLSKLREATPEFFDDKTQLSETQDRNSHHLNYFRQFANGWFKGEMKIGYNLESTLRCTDTLGLSEEETRYMEELRKIWDQNLGIAISGQYHLGIAEKGKLAVGFLNPYNMEFPRGLECRVTHNMINALCQGAGLSYDLITSNKMLPESLHVNGLGEISGCVKDYTIAKLEEADAPVGEFMQWLSDNGEDIKAARRLAVMAAYQANAIKNLTPYLKSDVDIMLELKASQDRYVQLALERFKTLSPPANSRMDYLTQHKTVNL